MTSPPTDPREAIISPCGRYRYLLTRRWAPHTSRPLLFVMLNPSTADALLDDPTIRRARGFAMAAGFTELEVVNLYAWRSTSPAALRHATDPVGPENDQHIREAMHRAGRVCVAWGSLADRLRAAAVLRLIEQAGKTPECLKQNRGGHPAHPLYLPGSCVLSPYAPPSTFTP